jgi:hypothetical protein
LEFPAGAREPTRRQWRRRVGRHAATVHAVPEGLLSTVMEFLRGYFVIFKLFNVIFLFSVEFLLFVVLI